MFARPDPVPLLLQDIDIAAQDRAVIERARPQVASRPLGFEVYCATLSHCYGRVQIKNPPCEEAGFLLNHGYGERSRFATKNGFLASGIAIPNEFN